MTYKYEILLMVSLIISIAFIIYGINGMSKNNAKLNQTLTNFNDRITKLEQEKRK